MGTRVGYFVGSISIGQATQIEDHIDFVGSISIGQATQIEGHIEGSI